MVIVVDIFAGLTAAMGWYYLFYSRAAVKLEGIEADRINRRRVRLRQTGGAIMMVMGVLFFAGFQQLSAIPFILVWTGVMLSLLAIVALALIDLRLTWGLPRSHRRRPP